MRGQKLYPAGYQVSVVRDGYFYVGYSHVQYHQWDSRNKIIVFCKRRVPNSIIFGSIVKCVIL